MRTLSAALTAALFALACSTPRDEASRLYLEARTLYAKGRADEALPLLESAHRKGDLASPAVLAGRILFFRNDYAEAERWLRLALDRRPAHVDARKWLVRVYLATDRAEEAERQVYEALAVSAEDTELLLLAGRAKRAHGDYSAALEYLGLARELSYRGVEVSLELADLYRGFGFPSRARAELEHAAALAGKDGPLSGAVTAALSRIDEEERK